MKKKTNITSSLQDLQEGLGRVGESAKLTATEFEKFGETMAPYFCRWWLRTRRCYTMNREKTGGTNTECFEIYVPWWGWPFEILHRAVFGSTKIQ